MNNWTIYLEDYKNIHKTPPGFHIQTMGCQMNERDSETMAGLLVEMGFNHLTSPEGAAVVIVNTCSVRDNADQRFFGVLGQLKRYKEANPDLVLAVCGCMMQQQHIVDKIKEKYKWVDLIFGTLNIHELPKLLINTVLERCKTIQVWDEPGEIVEGLPAKRLYAFKAYINIMFGCDNFCSYCIVPYTRGRERSRRPEDILAEVRDLANKGVKEIMLLGQNVNSYKGLISDGVRNAGTYNGFINDNIRSVGLYNRLTNNDERTVGTHNGSFGDSGRSESLYKSSASEDQSFIDFPELIYRLNEIGGIRRIRFMTSHPKDLSGRLITAFRDCEKLCKVIHLPVQSGSSRVLALMNRHYTKEHYLSLIEELKAATPDIVITTDLITGFPGETEDDFLETLDLVKRVRFDSAFTFLYSVREGTPAASMEDQTPEHVKHARFNTLVECLNAISAEINSAYVGRVATVLAEGPAKSGYPMMAGRTDGGKLVNFVGGPELAGQFVDVTITGAKTFSLLGKLYRKDL